MVRRQLFRIPSRSRVAALLACALVVLMPGVAHAAPPANDAFADAIEVTEPIPFTDSQDTSEATLEPNEPQLADLNCGSEVDRTVWYAYAPTSDTTVSANTFGSDFDTVLGVWEGSDLASLSLIGCVDDSGSLQSSVVFLAEGGVDYRIQVGGYQGDSGALSFRVREATAGFIEGTVIDDVTTDPIEDICVTVMDAVFGGEAVVRTAGDGTYRAAVRPGNYFVGFFDCQSDAYVPELWDDVSELVDATEVDVTADAATSGIDAALVPGCPGASSIDANQIRGTSGPDVLTGTDLPDVICGLGGDDVLIGLAAGDILLGGAGDDVLRGREGRDELFGNNGRDALFGGKGRDHLVGGAGRDVCDGGLDHDFASSCETERQI